MLLFGNKIVVRIWHTLVEENGKELNYEVELEYEIELLDGSGIGFEHQNDVMDPCEWHVTRHLSTMVV